MLLRRLKPMEEKILLNFHKALVFHMMLGDLKLVKCLCDLQSKVLYIAGGAVRIVLEVAGVKKCYRKTINTVQCQCFQFVLRKFNNKISSSKKAKFNLKVASKYKLETKL
jgi:hypothetical protein